MLPRGEMDPKLLVGDMALKLCGGNPTNVAGPSAGIFRGESEPGTAPSMFAGEFALPMAALALVGVLPRGAYGYGMPGGAGRLGGRGDDVRGEMGATRGELTVDATTDVR